MSPARLNLEHLATLLELVGSGSFSETATRLGFAQSTVSQHVKRLEDVLGARLILRGQRRCRPTPAALRLIPYAKSILSLEDHIISAVRVRALRLGACSNIGIYILPEILRGFAELGGRQPELLIGSNPDIATRLRHAEVDAALLEWWDERDGFNWQAWGNEPLVVITAPDHPLQRAGKISPRQLAKLSLIGGEEGTGTGRLLNTYLGRARGLQIAMQLGSTEAVKRAVAAGLGVSLVPACAVIEEIRDGRLCVLPLEGQPLEKSLRLVWREDLSRDEPLIVYLTAAAERAEAQGFN
jgi:DNA-binding transcriptional LysR family regulator